MGKVVQRYSPLVVLAVIQLVVILLSPSTPPTRSVTATGQPVGEASAFDAGSTDASTAGAADGTGSAASGAQPSARRAGSGAVRVGNATIGSSSAGGNVTACPGTQPAPWSYMPPCVNFSGTNGGETMTGVTDTEIRYVWYENVISPALAAVGSQTGLSYTPDELCSALKGFTTAVNKRWQLYGRKLVSLDGPGAHSGHAKGDKCKWPYYQADACDAKDSACYRAQADVIAAMKPKPAFVIGSTQVQTPFLDQLAKKGILVLGQGFASSFVEARAPYIWDWAMSFENASTFGSEYFCQKLVGQPVKYAGPEVLASGSNPLQPPTRKIAIIHDVDNPDTLSGPAQDFVRKIQKCGAQGVERFPFAADTNTFTQDMQTIAAKVKLGGFTTVYMLTEFLAPVPFSNGLAAQNWHPEIVIAGAMAIDNEVLAQLYNQEVWRYAFGVSQRTPLLEPQGPFYDYYRAYKDSGATDEPMKLAGAMWPYFWMAGDMFQMAGPSPTIPSIQTGMFSLPVMGGDQRSRAFKWGTPGDAYLGQRDVTEVWYCPTEVSPANGQPGRYMGVADYRRYQHGQIDRTMRVYPNGVCGS
ncbi:MAG: hypothetical protein QOG87_1672 [Actinomycetota bacterium]|jgi:hypothetical protein